MIFFYILNPFFKEALWDGTPSFPNSKSMRKKLPKWSSEAKKNVKNVVQSYYIHDVSKCKKSVPAFKKSFKYLFMIFTLFDKQGFQNLKTLLSCF